MELSDFSKVNESELSDEQTKLDAVWDLWAGGNAVSPYEELMTYQSEVNNGGHDQYFSNLESSGDLEKEMKVLESVLSTTLNDNLQKAHKAYLMLCENEDDEESQLLLEQCDDVFFENQDDVNSVLIKYAAKIGL